MLIAVRNPRVWQCVIKWHGLPKAAYMRRAALESCRAHFTAFDCTEIADFRGLRSHFWFTVMISYLNSRSVSISIVSCEISQHFIHDVICICEKIYPKILFSPLFAWYKTGLSLTYLYVSWCLLIIFPEYIETISIFSYIIPQINIHKPDITMILNHAFRKWII